MERREKPNWTLTAAAAFCAVCGLLALNGLEVQASDEALSLTSWSVAQREVPASYRADDRSGIMLGAAGPVLN